MNYARNKQAAKTRTTQPSLTDQSQAHATDINVIVKGYLRTGTAPGAAQQPINGDFTNLPTDLRGMIEESRLIKHHRNKLPKALREMPIEELLALTPERLTGILTPPDNPPAPPKDQPK